MDKSKVHMVRSAKGIDMLCVDGYLYHFENFSKNNTYRWLCNRRKSKLYHCKSRLLTKVPDAANMSEHRIIKAETAHSHPRCSLHEIQKVMARKKAADEKGLPCTIEVEKRKRVGVTNPIDFTDKSRIYMLIRDNGRSMIYNNEQVYCLQLKSANCDIFQWKCIRETDLRCGAFIRTVPTITGDHRLEKEYGEHVHSSYEAKRLYHLFQLYNIRIVDDEIFAERLKDADVPLISENEKYNCDNYSLECVLECDRFEAYSPAYKLVEKHIQPLNYDPLTEVDYERFSFFPSAKGKKVLCFQRNLYYFESSGHGNNRLFWTCIFRRRGDIKCYARVTLEPINDVLKVVRIVEDHCHNAPLDEIRKRLLRTKTDVSTDTQQQQQILVAYTGVGAKGINAEIKFIQQETEEEPIKPTPRKKLKPSRRVQVKRKIELKPSEIDMDLTKISKLRSAKGSELLCVDGFLFYAKNRGVIANEYYTCIKTRDPNYNCKCRLSVATQADGTMRVIRVYNRHTHKVSLDDVKRRLYNEIKVKSDKKVKLKPMFFIEKSLDEIKEEYGDLAIQHYRLSDEKPVLLQDFTHQQQTSSINATDEQLEIIEYDESNCEELFCEETFEMEDQMQSAPVEVLERHLHTRAVPSPVCIVLPEGADTRDLVENNSDNEEDLLQSQAVCAVEDANSMEQIDGISYQNGEPVPNLSLVVTLDSLPAIAVQMLLDSLNQSYQIKIINLNLFSSTEENVIKFNANTSEIPVLYDNDFRLSEFIAIMQYLCDKYSSKLYPTKFTERALVNERLCFCMTSYYIPVTELCLNLIYLNKATEQILRPAQNALSAFEAHLQRSQTKYCAIDEMTIADFALMSVTILVDIIKHDIEKYPLLVKWYNTFKCEYEKYWNIGKEAICNLLTERMQLNDDLTAETTQTELATYSILPCDLPNSE